MAVGNVEREKKHPMAGGVLRVNEVGSLVQLAHV